MNKLYLKTCAIMCILFVSSCTVENSLVEMNDEKTFTLEQARANFENNAEDLKLVSFLKPQNLDKARTKSDGETDWENIVPDWDNAVFGQKESSVAYMIPITLPGNLKAKFNLSFGRYRTYYHKDETVKSYLVVEKRNNGTVKRFLTTSIGDSGNRTSSEKPYLYTGSRRHFNGLFIVSSESGEAQLAYYYVNGRRFKMHISKGEGAHDHINSPDNNGSVGFVFRGSKPMTKGGDGGNSTGEDDMAYCYTCHQTTTWVLGTINGVEHLVCSQCGLPAEEIGGGELYFFCSVCGNLESNCICGNNNPDPNPDPDEDQYCPVCGHLLENCICIQGGGSGNGNHGNYGNPDGGNQYVRKPGDRLVNNDIPETFTPQMDDNECVINAISYLIKLLTGDNTTSGDVLGMIQNNLLNSGMDQTFVLNLIIDTMSNGLNPLYFNLVFNCLFNTGTASTNISNIIDAGHCIATFVQNETSYHMIIIVGYTVDNSWIFYDPTYGFLRTCESGVLDNDNSLTITSIKNGS